MFDTYRVQHGPSSVDVHVTEKRAPTDESVRLLKEMEDAARQKVTESFLLESNTFKGRCITYKDDMDDSIRYSFHYELNGRREEIKGKVFAHQGKPEIARQIFGELAERLALELCKGLKL